jgi:hypothetical protein
LVQGWQDTLDISSILDKNNTIDGSGFDFVFDNGRSIEQKSFGGYAPGHEHITITVKNRHIMDVCRTLAHELVHYSQDLKKELENEDAGATGSPQENQANAEAAVIMRNFGKAFPDMFGKEAIAG